MPQIEATRQADFITPPRAGQITALAVTTVAASASLLTMGNQTANQANANTLNIGLPGHYITLYADGGDVYILFGPDQASVSSGNAPSPTATGANATGACFVIPTGVAMNVRPESNVDQWIGYVTKTGTATLRIAQTSP
ncbi:MAG TPA: hypothetical protein VI159_01530 [Gemmatimonadales bacterium]